MVVTTKADPWSNAPKQYILGILQSHATSESKRNLFFDWHHKTGFRGWNFSTLRVLHWSGEEQSLQAVSAAEQEESHARMRAEAQAEGGNMKSMDFWGLCED